MRLIAVVVVALALTGCLVGPPRGQGEYRLSDAEIEAKDHGICTGIGLSQGSLAYADCRLRLIANRSSEASASRNRRGAVFCNRLGDTVICN
jgi:hypothetical protein